MKTEPQSKEDCSLTAVHFTDNPRDERERERETSEFCAPQNRVKGKKDHQRRLSVKGSEE